MIPRLLNRLLVLATLLAAVTAQSVLAQSDHKFDPQEVCVSTPLVSVQGILVWGEDSENGESGLYELNCPDLHITNNGRVVTVQASDIFKALATFQDDSSLLVYHETLRVRVLEGGKITADPVRGVSADQIDAVFNIVVTVTPKISGGIPQVVLKNAMPYVVNLPPDQAFTVTIDTKGELPNAWPTVNIDPKRGTVMAFLGDFH